MNIIESIKQHQNDFSNSELKICQYILQYPERVETATITRLAMDAQASTSAVLRFCKTLGFSGYKNFRFEMINYLHSQQQVVKPGSLIDTFLDGYVANFNQLRKIDSQELQVLANALTNSKINYILGIYYSSMPAKELALGLNDLGKVSLLADNYMNLSHITNSMANDSTLVMFSIDGNKRDFSYYLADLATDMPKNSFLITLNPEAGLSEYFEHTIVLPGRTFSNQSVVDTQTIPMLFVELLLNLIHEKI